MNKEEKEKLLNKLYYDYLDNNEAKKVIDYIINLEKENQRLKEQLQQKEVEIKDLCKKIKTNEKSRRKTQKSLMKKIQQKEDIINKSKEELIVWGEVLFPEFQEKMLKILDNKGE